MRKRPQTYKVELTEWEFNRLYLHASSEYKYYADLKFAKKDIEKDQEMVLARWQELYKKLVLSQTLSHSRVVALSQT